MEEKLSLSKVFSVNFLLISSLKGLKKVELHEITGISKNTLSSLAKGETKMIQFQTIELLAEALEVEPSEFFKDRSLN